MRTAKDRGYCLQLTYDTLEGNHLLGGSPFPTWRMAPSEYSGAFIMVSWNMVLIFLTVSLTVSVLRG